MGTETFLQQVDEHSSLLLVSASLPSPGWISGNVCEIPGFSTHSAEVRDSAGWPVSHTKGRPPFLHVIEPGSQGIHCVLGLVLVSKKTFLPWGLGSEVDVSRICGLSDSSEISRILNSKMLSE